MTFSEKLITLRGGRGWTQGQLAEKLGVTRQTVSNWERALSLPDAVGLTALSRVFNVDAERGQPPQAPESGLPAARLGRFCLRHIVFLAVSSAD